MSSREKILQAISRNKPVATPAPVVTSHSTATPEQLIAKFIATLESIGGSVLRTNDPEMIKTHVQQVKTEGHYVVNTIAALGETGEMITSLDPATSLEHIHMACIEGLLGVAENGAIWVEESKMHNRLLPFICQHLVLTLDAKKIVADMHQAYDQLTVNREGYGVFIAGPSKTADIEQSLVIGAHGARSMLVFLVE